MQLEIEIISLFGNALNKRIIDADLPGSGNMKAQHVGVFWFIFFETKDGTTVNTKDIAEQMNLAQSAVLTTTARLFDLGLIKREKSKIQNTKGRKMYEYSAKLSSDFAQSLIKSELQRHKNL